MPASLPSAPLKAVRLLAAALGVAVLLSGCGDRPSADGAPSAAASSADAVAPVASTRPPGGVPPCSVVWQVGARLPRTYAGCRVGETVAHDRRHSCSSGQTVVVHGRRWYAVGGGPVNRVTGAHPDHRLHDLLRICTG